MDLTPGEKMMVAGALRGAALSLRECADKIVALGHGAVASRLDEERAKYLALADRFDWLGRAEAQEQQPRGDRGNLGLFRDDTSDCA